MDAPEDLARRFEANRTHLRAVAYRMLGSRSEADDAVQEAWLRLSRAETSNNCHPERSEGAETLPVEFWPLRSAQGDNTIKRIRRSADAHQNTPMYTRSRARTRWTSGTNPPEARSTRS